MSADVLFGIATLAVAAALVWGLQCASYRSEQDDARLKKRIEP